MTGEGSPPPGEDGRDRYLHRIIRLRVELVIVVLLLASLLIFIVEYLGKTQHWVWTSQVPLDALATTTLSTGTIGVIWEWFIRKDATDQLRRTLAELGHAERPALAREVAATFIRDEELLQSLISTNNAARVLRAALTSASGHADLADGLTRGVLDRVLAADDYWENYRARVFITDSTDLLDAGGELDTFFDFHVEIRYELRLRKSIFRLAAASNAATLRELMEDRGFDGCWLVAPGRPYTELAPELFALEYMRIADIDLDITSAAADDRLVYTAESTRLGALIGERVEIEYRYRMKFDKRGHIFAMNVRVPTRRASYEFTYAESSIVHVNVFDLFVGASPVRLRTGQASSRPRVVELDTPDWLFPGGGVALSWVLGAERDEEYLRRIGGR